LKQLAVIIVGITGALLLYASGEMPDWADPQSPASIHVSPRYIEKSVEDTSVPNMVTAVLGDYRSYDTLGETAVIFTAGVCCVVLLRRSRL
jgi:multicomponent Na+:H+ antiporter subunit B